MELIILIATALIALVLGYGANIGLQQLQGNRRRQELESELAARQIETNKQVLEITHQAETRAKKTPRRCRAQS